MIYLNSKTFRFRLQISKSIVSFRRKKCNLKLSEDEGKLKKCLRLQCVNTSKRWQKANRTLRTFIQPNNAWLNEEFKIPPPSLSVKCFSNKSSIRVSSSSNSELSINASLKRKAFSNVSDRQTNTDRKFARRIYLRHFVVCNKTKTAE